MLARGSVIALIADRASTKLSASALQRQRRVTLRDSLTSVRISRDAGA